MEIKISQTRQIEQYEPRKIEVTLEADELDTKWLEIVKTIVTGIDKILYPENDEENETVETDDEKKNTTERTNSNNGDENLERIPF